MPFPAFLACSPNWPPSPSTSPAGSTRRSTTVGGSWPTRTFGHCLGTSYEIGFDHFPSEVPDGPGDGQELQAAALAGTRQIDRRGGSIALGLHPWRPPKAAESSRPRAYAVQREQGKDQQKAAPEGQAEEAGFPVGKDSRPGKGRPPAE